VTPVSAWNGVPDSRTAHLPIISHIPHVRRGKMRIQGMLCHECPHHRPRKASAKTSANVAALRS
jgi:hypothetical protein